MRYKNKTAAIGDIRVCSKFLWFPKCIDNEWRWLEFTVWKEKAVFHDSILISIYQIPIVQHETACFRRVAVKWLDGQTLNDTEWPRE